MATKTKKQVKNLKSPQSPKYKEGDIVLFCGEEVKISAESYVSHPEYLMGGDWEESGFFYLAEPLDDESEEIGGWIREKDLKPIKKVKKYGK